jgi:uncharacterized protein
LVAVLLAACSQAPETDEAASAAQVSPVPGPVLAAPEPPAGPFMPPSFDCAQAQGEVQTLVCVDQRLAELDREVARLAVLAGADPALDPERRAGLVAGQDAWTAARAACATSADLRGCVLRESVQRIAQLRRDHAHARSDDGAGISRGPSAWRCAGFDAPLSSVYVNGEPASLALAWLDQAVAMEATLDPDGVRYVGKGGQGEVVFVVKGTSAMFVQPGQPALSCEIEPAG